MAAFRAAGYCLSVALLIAADAADLYRQAVDRQRAGDLEGAVRLYKECLALEPANFQARSNLGAAFSALGRYDDAIAEYKAALPAAPPQFGPLLQRNLGLAYYKSGRLPAAAEIFSGLHRNFPAERDFALLSGEVLVQLGRPAQAAAILRPLAASAPSDKAAAYLFGVALLESGNPEEAQRVLEPILGDAESAEGAFALGLALFTRRDYPGAVTALARASQRNPSLARVFSFYGQALLFTGDPDGAAAAFRRQLSADANDYESNLRLAEILASRGGFTEAEPLLRRALLLRPESPEARAALDDVLARRFRRVGSPAAGIPVGAAAPAVEVERIGGGERLRLPLVAPGRPAVLVFGSYTCPQFRSAAAALDKLASEFASRVPFTLIYIREAHSEGSWQSTINERERVFLPPAATLEQKREHARACVRGLRLSFPAAVDGIDGAAEKAYAAWPSRVYVIGAGGRVAYSSGLGEFEFDSAALARAIRTAIAGAGGKL